MLIRSQDKTLLTNLRNATDIGIGYITENIYEVKAFLVDGNQTKLGEYSTAEKAIKVLDMIESFYSNFEYTKFLGCENDTFTGCIFQMPQNDEVKI